MAGLTKGIKVNVYEQPFGSDELEGIATLVSQYSPNEAWWEGDCYYQWEVTFEEDPGAIFLRLVCEKDIYKLT